VRSFIFVIGCSARRRAENDKWGGWKKGMLRSPKPPNPVVSQIAYNEHICDIEETVKRKWRTVREYFHGRIMSLPYKGIRGYWGLWEENERGKWIVGGVNWKEKWRGERGEQVSLPSFLLLPTTTFISIPGNMVVVVTGSLLCSVGVCLLTIIVAIGAEKRLDENSEENI
jgi:hypothetical protein